MTLQYIKTELYVCTYRVVIFRTVKQDSRQNLMIFFYLSSVICVFDKKKYFPNEKVFLKVMYIVVDKIGRAHV